jgi:hypothetical protein
MKIKHREIGVCGLSCRLCPRYHTDTRSRCEGCKSQARIALGCPFITCAVKKKEIEFCWDCAESTSCEKWARHRELGKVRDSFKCYQKLESDISFIQSQGVVAFEKLQTAREQILKEMLNQYNEGRSKSYYCIAATILEIDELENIISNAKVLSDGMNIKDRSKVLHSLIDSVAKDKNYHLKLRK